MSFDRSLLIQEIETLPSRLESLVGGLAEGVLETAVSPADWTIAQIIHHLADSHSWGLRRCKIVLTEEAPVIASYHQDDFAKLADGQTSAIMPSLSMLKGTHARWTILLKSLSDEDWQRTEVHVEFGAWQLSDLVANYVKHGASHLQQIKQTLLASKQPTGSNA